MGTFKILAFCTVLLVGCNIGNDKNRVVFKQFLQYYNTTVLKGKELVVAEKPIKSREYDEIWQTLNIDSLKIKRFTPLSIEKWDKTYFQNASFLSSADIEKIFYDVELQKKYYREGLGYYAISQPYLSRDGQYILIAMYYSCGDRCGYGKLQLFKAYQNTWLLVKTYAESIS